MVFKLYATKLSVLELCDENQGNSSFLGVFFL